MKDSVNSILLEAINKLTVTRTHILKRVGLISLAILLFNASFAQENFIPGFIIKSDKDTLQGFIDYRNWEKNPDRITYKEKMDGQAIIFEPTDISEFSVQGEVYVGGIVTTETSETETGRLDDSPSFRYKTDTTFLKVLYRGKKNLFYYRTAMGKNNFYITNDTDFELLEYKRYIKLDGTRIVVENNKYLGQLNLYLNDCPSIQSGLQSVSYKLKSLSNLFQDYYECTATEATYRREIKKTKLETGALAGISIATLQFSSDLFPELVNAKFDPSINLSGGLFLDIVLPGNQEKWSIGNELLFSTYKINGRYENIRSEEGYEIATIQFGYSYLKLNNLIRFKFPVARVHLFINGGISNGIAISETNYKKTETRFYSSLTIEEELALADRRKHEQGFIAGIGAKYRKYSFEGRYEDGNGMSVHSNMRSQTKRYYFLIGYKF